MKTRVMTVLAISLVLGGCLKSLCGDGDGIGPMTNELDDLVARKAQDPPAVEARLADLAKRAQIAAQGESQPQMKVAYYRIASIAAWQAGVAGGTREIQIRTDGAAACAALPPNQARPTDCAVIDLASSFAIADDWQTKLTALEQKYQLAVQTQCAGLSGNSLDTCQLQVKLPSSDGGTIKNDIFRGFREQFDAVSTTRIAMNGQASIHDSLKTYTDTQRLILYCSALESWSLFQDCAGSAADLPPMSNDVKSMLCRLSLTAQQCAATPAPQPAAVDCTTLVPPNSAPLVTAKDS